MGLSTVLNCNIRILSAFIVKVAVGAGGGRAYKFKYIMYSLFAENVVL
jgi:hypothetical protein